MSEVSSERAALDADISMLTWVALLSWWFLFMAVSVLSANAMAECAKAERAIRDHHEEERGRE